METLIKEITEICAKGNPEIMELKFGCKVKAQMWSSSKEKKLVWKNGIIISPPQSKDKRNHTCFYYVLFKDGADFCYHDIKILGRDITLEDVLMAIGKESSANDYTSWIDDECFETPHFLLSKREDMKIDEEKPILDWTLGKPLHLQSIETLQFIHNLLSNNQNK